MDNTESQRLIDIEKKVEGLERKYEGCKDMQDERMERYNDTFKEVKAGQQRLVNWHKANMGIVIVALVSIIIALLKLK